MLDGVQRLLVQRCAKLKVFDVKIDAIEGKVLSSKEDGED